MTWLQPVVAERGAHRVEEVDREVVVVIREQLVREVGERPHVRGAAPSRRRTGRAGHEPVGLASASRCWRTPASVMTERSGELTGVASARFSRSTILRLLSPSSVRRGSDLTSAITQEIIARTRSRK